MAMHHFFGPDRLYTHSVNAADGIRFDNATTVAPGADFTEPFWTGETWSDGRPPATLSKVGFMDLAYENLGGGMAGVQRYGEIIVDARTSPEPLVVASMERYDHATSFARDDVAGFLAIMVANGVGALTQAESDKIVNAWPNA